MSIELSEPYAPRPIRFIELWEHAGWRMKLYGITRGDESLQPELVATAKAAVGRRLEEVPAGRGNYGVGFVGIHQGRGANFVFVDWWADENELHHHVYISKSEAPSVLRAATDKDPSVCVWDLGVQAFEREAWLETVLRNSAGPDPEAYLSRRMDELV